MKIEKKVSDKKEIPKNTFTPKQARMVLAGLTKSITTTKDEMFVHLDGYGSIVLRAIKSGRCSRYSDHKVYAVRDCCVLVNGVGHNTYEDYLGDNDELLPIVRSVRPHANSLKSLNKAVGKHLSDMLFKLNIVGGGFEIEEMDGYDQVKFGQITKDDHDEEAVAVSE